MKHIIFAIISILLTGNVLAADNDPVAEYINDAADNDVTIKIPDGFKARKLDGDKELVINPGFHTRLQLPNGSIGWIYQIILESADGNCAILMPIAFFKPGTVTALGSHVKNEIKASQNDIHCDLKKHLNLITGPDMSRYSMADTAAVYPLNMSTPYLGKYNNCTGVYLRKFAHPAMIIKILMTDEGLAHKEKYLKTLFDSITYGNTPSETGILSEKNDFNRIGGLLPL